MGVLLLGTYGILMIRIHEKKRKLEGTSLTEITGLNLPTMLYKKYWETLLKRINT